MKTDHYSGQEIHALGRRLRVGFRPTEPPKPKVKGVPLRRPEQESDERERG